MELMSVRTLKDMSSEQVIIFLGSLRDQSIPSAPQ